MACCRNKSLEKKFPQIESCRAFYIVGAKIAASRKRSSLGRGVQPHILIAPPQIISRYHVDICLVPKPCGVNLFSSRSSADMGQPFFLNAFSLDLMLVVVCYRYPFYSSRLRRLNIAIFDYLSFPPLSTSPR